VSVVDCAIVKALPVVPRSIVRRISSRYIAGSTLDEAVRVVRELNGARRMATIDVLGEDVTSADEAAAITRAYHDVLARIHDVGLRSNISVKPTALGLDLGPELCRRNFEAVVADARGRGSFVRIDMEDSSTTDATLALYRDLRAAGFDNVGVVLQSRLRRTLDDVAGLDDVRLCKGIYLEPATIAFQDPDEVRASFVRCLEALLAQGSYVALATLDEELISASERLVREHGLGPDRYEFQMLLGVTTELGDRLVRDGHRLRIYVPFGTHWYEYSLRRLKENPRIAGYVAADLARRLRPRRRPSSGDGR
jgi:proline dehydrogenase